MALAIFVDAHAVAGDAALLAQVRAEVDGVVAADDALLGRFAAAIDSFPDESSGWWNRLLLIGEPGKPMLDLKKAGIFPIVHGVRSLALRDHAACDRHRGTARRAGRQGPPDGEAATDLVDSLHFLMTLKLKAGLAELDTGRRGERGRGNRSAEQPGARPAEGRAGGGQALQGAGAAPVPPGVGLRACPACVRAGSTRCAAAGCCITWPTLIFRSVRPAARRRMGGAGLRDDGAGRAPRSDHLDRRGAHRRQPAADQPATGTAGAA